MQSDDPLNTSDDALVERAVAGEDEALSQLLERHGLRIRNELSINPKWRSILDPDDVMQVTYLEAFLRIGQFSASGGRAFSVWLRRIAENNLRDAIRELTRDKRPPPQAQSPLDDGSYVALVERMGWTTSTPSRATSAREVQGIVEDALRTLPPDYEKVLRLYELEGRSGPEVVEILGRSHGAVKMLLARARDRLHECLGASSKFFSDTA